MRYALLSVLGLAMCHGVLEAQNDTLAARLEKLAPHAAGLALVEVLDTKLVDARPSDGPWYLDVRFRIVRSTGLTRTAIQVVKERGGHSPKNAQPFKPYGPVTLDTFKKGERHWVAFCSQYDFESCPQGVVASWPENKGDEAFEDAIRTDHYSHLPQYHPKTGFIHSYRVDDDRKNWRVRTERAGKKLWEAVLPGEKFQSKDQDGEWRLLQRSDWLSGLGETDEGTWFVMAESARTLKASNELGMPAGNYRVTVALNAETGKIGAVWISTVNHGPTSTPSVIRYLEQGSGRLRREERYDLLDKGGKAVGGDEERWLRKRVLTYDPDSGKVIGEETFRHAGSPQGSTYVPVQRLGRD